MKSFREYSVQSNSSQPNVSLIQSPGVPRDHSTTPGLFRSDGFGSYFYRYSLKYRTSLLRAVRASARPIAAADVEAGVAPNSVPEVLAKLFRTHFLLPTTPIADPLRTFAFIEGLAETRLDVAAAAAATSFSVLAPLSLASTWSRVAAEVLVSVAHGSAIVAHAPLERSGFFHPSLTIPPAHAAAVYNPQVRHVVSS